MNSPDTEQGYPHPSSQDLRPAFSIESAFAMTFAAFKTHYGLALGISAIIVLISLIAQIVDTVVRELSNSPGMQGIILVGACFSLVWTFAVSVPIQAGMLLPVIRKMRGQNGSIIDMLAGYRRYIWVLLYTLTMGVGFIVLCLPFVAITIAIGLLVNWNNDTMLITILLLAVLMLPLLIYFTLRFQFTSTIILDDAWGNLNTFQAFGMAWRITRGRVLSLFLLNLCFGIILISSILLLCIGIVFVGYPILICGQSSCYILLSEPYIQRQPTPVQTDVADICPRCGSYYATADAASCSQCGTPRSWFRNRGI